MTRLLLIEDDPDIRTLLERFLKRSGFAVTMCSDGEAGIKAFTDDTFDLVLTDGLLPKKSGYEIARAIRAMPSGAAVGIVMITAAFKGPKAKKDALDGGIDAFFSKPFVLSDLKEKLVELLRARGKDLAPPATLSTPAKAPAAASGTGMPAPPTSDSGARRAPEPPPREAKVGAPVEVARLLLSCARHRLSGVVTFTDAASQLKLAFLRGVVVGAADNLREHLLGERLWKQGRITNEQMRMLNARIERQGERVAEALLALGLCTADEALNYVDEQAKSRVRRALLWSGSVTVDDNEAEAHRLAVSSLELIDLILAFGLEPAQLPDADRFVAAYKSKSLQRAPGFDELLLALARTRPDAVLPSVVIGGVPTVAEATRGSSSSEVYAAWLGGLVRFADDPPADPRPLPDVMRAHLGPALTDRDLVHRICALLIRGRGRTYYALLELPPTATCAQALARLKAIDDDVGPDAVAGRVLGPAAPAAEELWTLLEDARRTFADDDFRASYDALLAPTAAPPAVPAPPVAAGKNEDAFLRGQEALQEGNLPTALGCFELAAASRASDADYQSYLGYARVLNGDRGGVQLLMRVMREHPQSMRPLFFLGMLAARDGDLPKARTILEECTRRAPLDIEVQAALRAFSG